MITLNSNWRSHLTICVILISFGAIIAIPYFIWHSFWCLGISIICVTCSFALLLYSFFQNNGEDIFINSGIYLAIVLTILCFFWHEDRYISTNKPKQHIYEDCPTLKSKKDIKLITETEGFFYLKFTDCSICTKRRKHDEVIRRYQKTESERDELREYLQDMIDRLNNGESPFKIEHELAEDWSDDYM